MISRVAESLFWLSRYVERADNMARLLRVNRSFLLDVNLPHLAQWYPVLVVCGEQHRFPELYPQASTDDAEAVQGYLTWDEDCPVGIAASIYWARENARTVRETISLDMWESLNGLWHWLRKGKGKRRYRNDRDAFYAEIRDAVALFHGICHDSMLHDEPFDFMRLGMLLERAGQTARMMDVKYHLLGPRTRAGERSVGSLQWVALLRSCSAEESFLRRYQSAFSSTNIVAFLLQEELFPRSVLHCLSRSLTFLQRIQAGHDEHGVRSVALLEQLVASIAQRPTAEVLATGLHQELTRVVDATAEVCEAIHHDFFDPRLPASIEQPRAGVQGQA